MAVNESIEAKAIVPRGGEVTDINIPVEDVINIFISYKLLIQSLTDIHWFFSGTTVAEHLWQIFSHYCHQHHQHQFRFPVKKIYVGKYLSKGLTNLVPEFGSEE